MIMRFGWKQMIVQWNCCQYQQAIQIIHIIVKLMLQPGNFEKPVVRIILAVLLILEIFCIAVYYRFNFDEYIIIVVVLLIIPIAYFAFCYLTIAYRQTTIYEAIPKLNEIYDSTEQTRRQVNKLIKSPAYEQYQRVLLNKKAHSKQAEQEKEESQNTGDDETTQIADELEQKEDLIFDL